jgi:dihydrofolate synthase/folylpolyglutamate synthase
MRERISINNRMITKPAMVEMAKKVQAAAAKAKVEPTFFEAMTAMAFKHFADEAVDIAVVEVGLGGRLDSTNVLTPLVTVVTTIDFDHTRILGDTLPKIAREKAGIFKRGVPAIVFDAQPEVNKTFIEVAEKVGAELKIVNKDIEFSSRFCTSPELGPHTRVCYYTKQSRIEHLPVPLPGEHQATNCGLALAAVECVRAAGFDCPEHLVTGGLAKTKVMGRMDLISDRPRVLVDGAHNPSSLNALMRCVGAHVPYDSMVCVFGCCQDKDVGEMLDRLNLGADKVIFTKASSNPRAADPYELQKLFQERSGKMSQVARTVGEAIQLALRATSQDDLVCVTGSFYVVGDAMKYVSEQSHFQSRRPQSA